LKLYRCTVQFRQNNPSRSEAETFTIEAESIREAAETMRDWFPLRSEGGHQGFTIKEVNRIGVRPL